MSEREQGLASVGAGPRHHYLQKDGEEIMLVYPIGGSWNTGELKGYRFKLLGDCFGNKKFHNSKVLYDDFASAKVAAKAYYVNFKDESI
jgi:hypothetical protein